jgi:hypothetical protein
VRAGKTRPATKLYNSKEIILRNIFPAALSFLIFLLAPLCAYGQGNDPVKLYPDNYKVRFENDRARVVDFKLKKGAKENAHMHPAHVAHG